MEELKDEIGKVKEGLSKVISDASEIVMDRFKNPYIIAFCISWIAFNWKPIAFFIFSKGNVEYKILTIKQEYSDIWHYFFYPLGSAIIFLFFIPYLNLFNEWFLQFSIKKRASYIKNQVVDKLEREKDIAIAEDKKQKAITIAREGEIHNEYVDKLNENISNLNETLANERLKHLDEVKSLQIENQTLTINVIDAEKKYSNEINAIRTDIIARQEFEKEQGDEYKALKNEVEILSKTLRDKNYQIGIYESLIKDVTVSNSQVFRFHDDRGDVLKYDLLEYHNIYGVITYYNLLERRIMSNNEAEDLKLHYKFSLKLDENAALVAVDNMMSFITDEERYEIENKRR
ncbi:hypothetical protein [Chryseobacterium sp. 22543]|uniref:hypothetical protein n=1 Tax=Chryseobacterium sp. 22543 TaxID=3453940 RepID=UPI003F84F434